MGTSYIDPYGLFRLSGSLIVTFFISVNMDGKDPKSIAMQVAASLAQR